MTDRILENIDQKITSSEQTQFLKLQCVALNVHDPVDNFYKSLHMDGDNNLKVFDSSTAFTTETIVSGVDLGPSTVTADIDIKKNTDVFILLEATDNGNDVNHLTVTPEVKIQSAYFELDAHYYIVKKNDRTIQIVLNSFKSPTFRLRIVNNKGSLINVSISVSH